jgi:hypothetical protein
MACDVTTKIAETLSHLYEIPVESVKPESLLRDLIGEDEIIDCILELEIEFNCMFPNSYLSATDTTIQNLVDHAKLTSKLLTLQGNE